MFAIDLSGVRRSENHQLSSVEGVLIGTAGQQKRGRINFAGQRHQMSGVSSAAGAAREFCITTVGTAGSAREQLCSSAGKV